MKILLSGGSGILGSELVNLIKKTECEVFFPTSKYMDITDINKIKHSIEEYAPDVFVHASAFTDVKRCETELEKSIDVNIIGTCNVVKACSAYNLRLVHISTDYVFDGNKGDYSINDPINPITKYAKSKAAAELSARMYNKSLVIRTSFYGKTFPYDKAVIDQWTTKDYIDIIAPMVLKEIMSNKIGVVHCKSKKRTIYEIAKDRTPTVVPVLRKELNILVPKDTSLI